MTGPRPDSDAEEQRRIDQDYVEAYTRVPQTPESEAAAWVSLRESILEEPW